VAPSNVLLNTLQIISEMIFQVKHLTGTKHPAFSTNHLTDTDKTEQQPQPTTTHKPKQPQKENYD